MSRTVIELAYGRELARSGRARALRVDAGLTLADVARDCGVAPSTVLRWERGQTGRGAAALRYVRLLQDLELIARELGQ
jgi:transcriptional regulator with XRE-family HTH domain